MLGRAAETSVFSGRNPLLFTKGDPLSLFFIQLIVILLVCRAVNFVIRWLNQPKVISEIIGGIILGPTVLGRWTAFSETVFPQDSLSYLGFIANFGLVLFLFMVGMEMDTRVFLRKIKSSVLISAAGIVFPFLLGMGVSYLVYSRVQKTGEFFIFMLFCGVSMSITAFPVLARILNELKLLKTRVGIVTITAASVDDIIAWVLLALVITLSKSANKFTALWISLTGLAYVVFVLTVVKKIYVSYLKRHGYLGGRDPTPHVVFITFTMVFLSAWFTDILGIHAIFGGYIIGIIVPHSNGFAIKLTEKIEDLVSIFFLPIYFALSGLKTDLGSIDGILNWLLLVLIVVVAFLGKVVGCFGAARLVKLDKRESLTIGVLMSCKGLVELIVLNIGLEAKLINEQVFSILVFTALVLTVVTTPIVKFIYPKSRQKYAPSISSEQPNKDLELNTLQTANFNQDWSYLQILIVLNKMQQIPSVITLVNILNRKRKENLRRSSGVSNKLVNDKESGVLKFIKLSVLRLVELTGRDSSIMLKIEKEDMEKIDPVLSTFRAYTRTANLKSTFDLAINRPEMHGEKVAEQANVDRADLLMLSAFGVTQSLDAQQSGKRDGFFEEVSPVGFSIQYDSVLVDKAIKSTTTNVAVFINRGLASEDVGEESFGLLDPEKEARIRTMLSNSDLLETKENNLNSLKEINKNLFKGVDLSLPIVLLPFFGGKDDRLALSTLVQLCGNSNVNVLVVHFLCTAQSTIQVLSTGSSSKNPEPFHPTTDIHGNGGEGVESQSARLGTEGGEYSRFYSTSPMVSVNHEKKLVCRKSDVDLLESLLEVEVQNHFSNETLEGASLFGRLDTSNNTSNGDESRNPNKNRSVTQLLSRIPQTLGSMYDTLKPKATNPEELPTTHQDVEEKKCELPPLNFSNLAGNGSDDGGVGGSLVAVPLETAYNNVKYVKYTTNNPMKMLLAHILCMRKCDIVVCGRNHGSILSESAFKNLIALIFNGAEGPDRNSLHSLQRDEAVLRSILSLTNEERRRSIGDLSEALIICGSNPSILVMDAHADGATDI